MFHGSEEYDETLQSGIFLAAPRINDLARVRLEIETLSQAIDANDLDLARAVILNLVPEYTPA
jgi:hypothetical protein